MDVWSNREEKIKRNILKKFKNCLKSFKKTYNKIKEVIQMNGYQKLKEQNEALKREAEYNLHRATVYLLAMMSHIEKDDPKMKKIVETAKSLFRNYKEEEHGWDPLLKLYENENR